MNDSLHPSLQNNSVNICRSCYRRYPTAKAINRHLGRNASCNMIRRDIIPHDSYCHKCVIQFNATNQLSLRIQYRCHLNSVGAVLVGNHHNGSYNMDGISFHNAWISNIDEPLDNENANYDHIMQTWICKIRNKI